MENTDNNKKARIRERAFWGGLAVALVGVLLVLTITPTVFAQNRGTEQAIDVFETVFRFIQDNYVDGVDAQELLDGALKGMFESLDDPYSVFLDERAMRDLNDSYYGGFGGVGIYISKQQTDEDDATSGFVEVIAPIEGTPADQAGIHAGDLIIGIQVDPDGEFISTEGLTIDEVVSHIRGEPGTVVTLNIRRGSRAEFPVSLVRDNIELPTVRHAMIPDAIAYLRITQFSETTTGEIEDALESFRDADYESLIIDLRSNPGGSLSGVVDVADLFFDEGTIVGTSHRDPSQNETFGATPGVSVDPSIPIIVLVDKGSASASEILAGVLQDRDRAYLIGETTYGKGSVQWFRSLGDTGFKLTTARYYLPSGRFIDGMGIDPDREVLAPELTDEQLEVYAELRQADLVAEWVVQNLAPTEGEIANFVSELQASGYDLPDRWLELIIQTALDVENDVDNVYDLRFDVVLQEAVRLLETGEVSVR
jgi:carboxyl-terminal processing protease